MDDLPVRLRLVPLICLALLIGPASGAMPADPTDERRLRFAVTVDGRPVGWHEFRLSGAPRGLSVDGHARFDVTVLGLPVYRYEHRDRELWRDGCLEEIDATTDDDGRRQEVHGRRVDAGFDLDGPGGRAALAACVSSYAYWDPDLVTRRRLLNAQAGTLDSVDVVDLGTVDWIRSGRREPSRHYAIIGTSFRIDLWYSTTGDWLGLETRTTTRHTLRYELRP